MTNSAVLYSKSQRHHPDPNKYLGATSFGNGWEVRWRGPYNDGPSAVEMARATLQHLQHVQQTDAASENNAKLMFHLIKAIEEIDNQPPSVGGDLNKLIPKD